MNQLLGKYKNGNYIVTLYDDGTKIRKTKEDCFIPEFAENIDIKICNRCDMNCKFCHEGSTKNGRLGNILNAKWIETLKPYQEVAIGGGNVFEHPDLITFLKDLKKAKVIANITVHQYHFERNQKLIESLVKEKLIYGLGVSLVNPSDEFISLIKKYPNAVIHVINGILTKENAEKLMDHDLKLLILGYKKLRRGNDYFQKEEKEILEKQEWLYRNLPWLINKFEVVSFDNLAIEQLKVKRLLTEKEWEEFYMGDDASFTYYIDAVEGKFAKNSTAPLNERYDLLDDVVEMFQKIKN